MPNDLIVVGIPSWAEESTIAHVVQQADAGLAAMGVAGRAVIVNADNASPDGTRRAFESVPTVAEKVYLSTAPGVRGKGHNIENLLRYATSQRAVVLTLLDADLESITPQWIPRLLDPVLRGGADFVSPVYTTSQGGPLRNLISRPLVTGLFGTDVPQPTGGEVSLSARLAARLVDQPLPQTAWSYGIDVFLTTEAVLLGSRNVCTDLGHKLHRRRPWDTIAPIAEAVVASVLSQVVRHRAELAGRTGPPSVVPAEPSSVRPLEQAERAGLLDHFHHGRPAFAALYQEALRPELADRVLAPLPDGLPRELWRPTVYGLVRHAVTDPDRVERCAAALMPLFEGRMVTYAADAVVESLADFHTHRLDALDDRDLAKGGPR
ncbi:glycosyltransferase [Amycolatopsis sp. cmx-4-68]|uniref:glycosyltransferase n=1 Tax=Amycolatopsis sp. cmx-4-68 TaxID=2790938 RepID=UPI0039798500